MVSVLLVETLIVDGLHELQVLRRAMRSSVTDPRRSGWPTTAVTGCFHSKRQTAYNQQLVTELAVSKGSVNKQYRCLKDYFHFYHCAIL